MSFALSKLRISWNILHLVKEMEFGNLMRIFQWMSILCSLSIFDSAEVNIIWLMIYH